MHTSDARLRYASIEQRDTGGSARVQVQTFSMLSPSILAVVKPVRKRGYTGENKSIAESVYTDPVHVVLEASSAHEAQRRRVDYCPVKVEIRREWARERESAREGERGHHKQEGREIPCSRFFSLFLCSWQCGACMTNEITRQVHVCVCARTCARDFMNR